MALRILASFTKLHEAYLARNQLEIEGINSSIFDEYTIGVHPFYSNALGGVKIVVDETDFEKSIEIITAYIDFQKKHFLNILEHCPNCNSSNIRKTSSFHIAINIILILVFGILWVIFYKKNKCYDCGHRQAW